MTPLVFRLFEIPSFGGGLMQSIQADHYLIVISHTFQNQSITAFGHELPPVMALTSRIDGCSKYDQQNIAIVINFFNPKP